MLEILSKGLLSGKGSRDENQRNRLVGKLIGQRYRILEALSSGGFSNTYVAEDPDRPGKPKCVVKHLRHDNAAVRETVVRLFNEEAKTLEKLGEHNQIPRLLAHFNKRGEFYLVQEYFKGHTLSDEIQPGRVWSDSRVYGFLLEMLKILKFVHAQGCIHRDVKPDNIIRRDHDRKLCLVDFGTVKQVIAADPTEPQKTVRAGTPLYMPIEQVMGYPKFNSDLYALGIIAAQALTGLDAERFRESPADVLQAHHLEISQDLLAVVCEMLQVDYKKRSQSAQEVIQALSLLSDQFPPDPDTDHPSIEPSTSNGPIKTVMDTDSDNSGAAEVNSGVLGETIKAVLERIGDYVNEHEWLASLSERLRNLTIVESRIAVGAAIAVVIAGGFSLSTGRSSEAANQSLQSAIKHLQEKDYEACEAQAKAVPDKFIDLRKESKPLAEGCAVLAEAKQLAKTDFKSAIEKLDTLSNNVAVSKEAKTNIQEFSNQLDKQATGQYKEGTIRNAISTLEAIPNPSRGSQEKLKKWTQELRDSIQAQNEFDLKNWENAISDAGKVMMTGNYKLREEAEKLKEDAKRERDCARSRQERQQRSMFQSSSLSTPPSPPPNGASPSGQPQNSKPGSSCDNVPPQKNSSSSSQSSPSPVAPSPSPSHTPSPEAETENNSSSSNEMPS
jgi:serine/threonine protein kinase